MGASVMNSLQDANDLVKLFVPVAGATTGVVHLLAAKTTINQRWLALGVLGGGAGSGMLYHFMGWFDTPHRDVADYAVAAVLGIVSAGFGAWLSPSDGTQLFKKQA